MYLAYSCSRSDIEKTEDTEECINEKINTIILYSKMENDYRRYE